RPAASITVVDGVAPRDPRSLAFETFVMRRPVIAALHVLGGVMLTLVAPAQASISPAAQAIVDRYVEATGGAEALAADTTIHVKGRVRAIDLKGSFEQWAALPD